MYIPIERTSTKVSIPEWKREWAIALLLLQTLKQFSNALNLWEIGEAPFLTLEAPRTGHATFDGLYLPLMFRCQFHN
jgi:hypothetical protein